MGVSVEIAPEEALASCIAIRSEVFIAGQRVPEAEEFDGLDSECTQFLARLEGSPIGTARLRLVDGAAKAERVAVLEAFRGRGVGRALMTAVEDEARRRGIERVVLHAQVRVLRFYEGLGYRATSGIFMEADIAHRAMEKRL